MKKIYFPGGLFVLVLCMIGLPANAALFQVDVSFTGNDFQSTNPFIPPPDSSVSGSYSLFFDDSGISGSGLESLHLIAVSSISLTIDNFVYSPSDVYAYINFYNGDPYRIGVSRIPSVPVTSPGFTLRNVPDPPPANLPFPATFISTFTYWLPSLPDETFIASSVTDSIVITSAVPIPAAAWLFCYGLIGLIGAARYKKTA